MSSVRREVHPDLRAVQSLRSHRRPLHLQIKRVDPQQIPLVNRQLLVPRGRFFCPTCLLLNWREIDGLSLAVRRRLLRRGQRLMLVQKIELMGL